MIKRDNFGTVLIIIAATSWGIMGIFVRCLSAIGFSPMQIVCSRLTIGALLFLITLMIKERENLKKGLAGLPLFFVIGVCNILFFTWCYFTAINMMDVSVAAILLYTSPIWVMIASVIFFKEKVTKQKIIAIVMAFLGCVLISGITSGSISALGLIAGVCAGIGYGMYSIFGTVALKKYSTLTITTYSFIFASIGAWCLSSPKEMIALYTAQGTQLQLIIITVLMGLFTAYIPFLTYTMGLEHVAASKASVLATVEPIVATIVGIVVFKEALTPFSVMGIFCVLGAIIVLSKNDRTV